MTVNLSKEMIRKVILTSKARIDKLDDDIRLIDSTLKKDVVESLCNDIKTKRLLKYKTELLNELHIAKDVNETFTEFLDN